MTVILSIVIKLCSSEIPAEFEPNLNDLSEERKVEEGRLVEDDENKHVRGRVSYSDLCIKQLCNF